MSVETSPASGADISRTSLGASQIEAHPTPCVAPAAASIVSPPRELFVRLHRFTHPRHTVHNLMCYSVSLRTIPSRCLLRQLAQITDVAIALRFPFPMTASTRNPEGPPRWSSRATMSPQVVDAEQLTFHPLFDPDIKTPSRISVNRL
jgi:hypothetical protein